jgi:hypothetical protein
MRNNLERQINQTQISLEGKVHIYFESYKQSIYNHRIESKI